MFAVQIPTQPLADDPNTASCPARTCGWSCANQRWLRAGPFRPGDREKQVTTVQSMDVNGHGGISATFLEELWGRAMWAIIPNMEKLRSCWVWESWSFSQIFWMISAQMSAWIWGQERGLVNTLVWTVGIGDIEDILWYFTFWCFSLLTRIYPEGICLPLGNILNILQPVKIGTQSAPIDIFTNRYEKTWDDTKFRRRWTHKHWTEIEGSFRRFI